MKILEKVKFTQASNGIPSRLHFTIKDGAARSGYGFWCSVEVASAIAKLLMIETEFEEPKFGLSKESKGTASRPDGVV